MVKTYERTQDVLDHVRAFHDDLGKRYEQLSSESQQERIKMLLNYLGRHERHLEECLADYEETASRGILETWFKFVPQEARLLKLDDMKLTPDMSVDDIVDVALRMDNCVVELYRELADISVSQQVKDVFTNLLTMEEEQKHKMIRNTLMLNDL